MSITINLKYRGENGAAQSFAREMIENGTVAAIRAEEGNEAYDYFISFEDPEVLLLIDQWRDQESLDIHHESPMMATIAALREKYDLHMEVKCFAPISPEEHDSRFIRE